ncbi:MAG: hypothetical protein AB1798_05370 [Spirochaetota bacterium]
MTTADWLNFFKDYSDIKIFHINHLKLFSSLKEHALRMSLTRLTSKKIIQRICRGFYANPFNLPGLEEIAAAIYQPSYISLESALSVYGILSQLPMVLTCVTTQLPQTFKTSFGTIAYHQIKRNLFWGFVEKSGYFIAEPEKALLDYIYFNSGQDLKAKPESLAMDVINLKTMKVYSKKMNVPWGRHRLKF